MGPAPASVLVVFLRLNLECLLLQSGGKFKGGRGGSGCDRDDSPGDISALIMKLDTRLLLAYFGAFTRRPSVLFCLVLPLFCRCFAVVLPLFCRCFAVVLPLFCRCFAVVLPLFCRCFAVVLPLFCRLFWRCNAQVRGLL